MANRKQQHEPDAPAPTPEASPTTAVADAPPAANGPAPTPAEAPQAPTKPKRRRDPNAIRPHYYLIAVERATDRERIVGRAETVGRARKLVPSLLYALRDGEAGPFVVRAKLVS